MTMLRLDSPTGYVNRITRTKNVHVPRLLSLQETLYMAWSVKMLVRRMMKEILKYDMNDDNLLNVMDPPDEQTNFDFSVAGST